MLACSCIKKDNNKHFNQVEFVVYCSRHVTRVSQGTYPSRWRTADTRVRACVRGPLRLTIPLAATGRACNVYAYVHAAVPHVDAHA